MCGECIEDTMPPSAGRPPAKPKTTTRERTSARRSSLQMAELNIPTESEKKRVTRAQRMTCENSFPETPPANSGMAMTGKIARVP